MPTLKLNRSYKELGKREKDPLAIKGLTDGGRKVEECVRGVMPSSIYAEVGVEVGSGGDPRVRGRVSLPGPCRLRLTTTSEFSHLS